MRSRLTGLTPDENEFRDGVHCAATWALATLLTALFIFAGAQSLTRLAAPSTGTAGPSTSVGGVREPWGFDARAARWARWARSSHASAIASNRPLSCVVAALLANPTIS